MKIQQRLLTELLACTEGIAEQVKGIHNNMKENELESFAKIQVLLDQREKVLNQLDVIQQQQPFGWTENDQQIIQKLKSIEQTVQLRMNELYQSFARQMKRVQQTKSVSKKYLAAYQTLTVDGSFIDRRK